MKTVVRRWSLVVSFVILSGAGVERSGTPAQSKDPYPKQYCWE